MGYLVSFPHCDFLLAIGHLAKQLKTREWIVARTTSITDCVVDSKVRTVVHTVVFALNARPGPLH